ncbi:MAG: VOC family protein [Hyphomicrobiales bacterium]|nr:VOC family protein [Hyphomicrobiales bacterium]
MTGTAKLRTCLWFNGKGEEAAEFYVSLLPESHIEKIYRPDPDGPALVTEFTLAGAPYMTLNGGPHFDHSPAASVSVLTKDQAETDRLWETLTADGGQEGQCAWLTDKYGVSWQIVPEVLPKMVGSDDKAAAARAHRAMMGMTKIDIAALEAAFHSN